MVALPRPAVILTHESDLDGLMAGVLLQRLFRQLFNGDCRLEAYHYDHWLKRPLKESSAWATDFAFDSRLDKPNWVVIDHHPTDVPAKNAYLIHDLTKSASLLCYELCRQCALGSPALDRLVHLSNVGDLFLQEDPDFLLATDYGNLVKSYGFWNLHALIDGELEALLDHPLLEVMAVKRRVEDPIGLAWSRANVQQLSPTVGFVDTVLGNTNLIVNELLNQNATPYPVLLTLYRKGSGTIFVSLRSRQGEALRVAETLQGGGHSNAAGATLPRSVQRIPDALDYLRKVLNPAPPKKPPLNSLESLLGAFEVKS